MLMLLTTTLLGSVRTRTNDLTTIRTRTNDLPATTVCSAGLANISCFRIPSIVRTPAGALVAFAEARHGSCGDGNVYAIHGIDTGGPAAIIASVENCGHTTITSPAWKCVSENP